MKYILIGFVLSMRKLSNTFLYCSENKDKEIYNIHENINKKNLLDELEKNDISIYRKLDLLKKHNYTYKQNNNNLTDLFNEFY
jgi:hypothetical protein